MDRRKDNAGSAGTENTTPNVTKEAKRKEAIHRMGKLGLNHLVIDDFRMAHIRPIFAQDLKMEYALVRGLNDLVHDFERKYNALVYAIICCQTNFGLLESLLYVSDEEEEWEMEIENIKDGYVMTWTENLDYPECSEFGSISIRINRDGLLCRVD